MRISTITMFEQGTASMNRQQSEFLKVSQQLASGRRVVNPSDDPQAAARAVRVDQSKAMVEQYQDSRISARNALSQSESILNSVSDAITKAKTLTIQAASDTLSDADRQSIGSELRGVYETLLGQANATDGNGRYLFGGYKDDAPPFEVNGDKAIYVGSSESREQRVDAERLMPVTFTGQDVFRQMPGNTEGDDDLFATIEEALRVLDTPATSDAEKADLRDTLNASMRKFDSVLDNVLTVRASAGARLNELDVIDAVGDNRMLNYEQTLSDLVDLDYAEAISEYMQRQMGFQASQQTFANVNRMSLFEYL
ncbi:flagellar hook-associated protein FlgL [Halomonas dongshanensis]|uniref:Flagellar hook-associated protein FlgL n=1 Tax=Halomonas dongshanensis TaxID=2890835 RepID=A0ABT2EGI8_9GAMM|nr:flagellar hook-associated protein FlgL [Halomonas dongshanensis]MCS2610235.1 flagellar hook-associated protein FlgL [Halomonas dongshanensis]